MTAIQAFTTTMGLGLALIVVAAIAFFVAAVVSSTIDAMLATSKWKVDEENRIGAAAQIEARKLSLEAATMKAKETRLYEAIEILEGRRPPAPRGCRGMTKPEAVEVILAATTERRPSRVVPTKKSSEATLNDLIFSS